MDRRYFALDPCMGIVRITGIFSVLALCLLSLSRAHAETIRVSNNNSGFAANNMCQTPAISANGKCVAFTSYANNLVANDTNESADVFVYDRQTGRMTRVSVSSTGAQGYADSPFCDISGDGRYVAFSSSADTLVPGDTNGLWDVFRHDRQTGETIRVSVSSNGEQGNNQSGDEEKPIISEDGRYVLFRSMADNFIVGDRNYSDDAFLHDCQTGETTAVALISTGSLPEYGCTTVNMSADARYIVYSTASDILPSVSTWSTQAYLRDRQTGEVSLVSSSSTGTPGNGYSTNCSVSCDGRYIAFDSDATNLIDRPTHYITHVFIKDRVTGEVVCASVTDDGVFGNNTSSYPEISQDGSHVTYRSLADNLDANDTNEAFDVFVYDRIGASLTCASVTPDGFPGSGSSNQPEISATGRDITFMSSAWDLVPEIPDYQYQIYVYDAGSSLNIAPVAMDATFNINEDSRINDSLTASDANDDPLIYSIVQAPTYGSAQITNTATGAFTYRPNPNANGQDTFTFAVSDGTDTSNTATVTINIAPVNDVPVAQSDVIVVNMNTPLNGTLPATDVDNDPLTYYLINDGEKGSVTVNTQTGAFTYTPDADVTGSDLFTFKVNDGQLESSVGTIYVSIIDQNSAPVAEDSTYDTDDTTSINSTMIATDANGNPLTFYLILRPTAGTLVVTNTSTGAFTYTPATGKTGQYTFSFIAYDGALISNVGTVTFNVTGPNFTPVAENGTATTCVNMPVNGMLVATDANGDPLTYALVANSTQGSAVIDGDTGAFTYTPNTDVTGTDTFTFKANDGIADSNTATITVTITRINSVPVAEDGAATTDEDTPVDGTLTATDSDGDPLTYQIASNGAKGQAVITDASTGAFTYTPTANASGQDTFIFKANDGVADSNTATVTVTINPADDAPVALDGTATVDEDSSVDGTLSATDADGDPLTFTLVGNGNKGSAVINAQTGAFTYTPTINANGQDTFTFTANDGVADSNTATVTVTINPMNDMPYVQDFEVVTSEDIKYNGQLHGYDPDGDPLTFRIVSIGTKGIAAMADASPDAFTYEPAPNLNGQDTFTCIANDGTVDSNLATATVTIFPVSDDPVAQDSTATTDEDTPVDGTLLANDADGDRLTFSLVSDAAKGSVQIHAETGAFTYTPNADVYDEDTFTFKANDGQADSNTATVTITILPVNDAPVAANGTAATAEDTPVGGTLTASDTENDPLTFRIIADGAKGHAAVINAATGAFTYTPSADANGQDTFTFAANDGADDSNTATMTVTITPANDLPVARNSTATTNEDTPVGGMLSATDTDGDPLTFALIGNGNKGSAEINAQIGAFIYTPSADVSGEDSFTFTARDGQGNSNTATVTVTIRPQNDAPVAENGTLAVNANQSATGTLVATDIDGDPLTYQTVATPSKGTVVVTNAATGAYRYTPTAGVIGEDSFTFRANDGQVNSNTATVHVTISPIIGDNAPVITSLTGPTEPINMRDSFIIEATFTDPDAGDTHTARLNWGDGRTTEGTVNQEAHTVFGNHAYNTPGVYTVTLTVTDSKGKSDTEIYRYLYVYDPTVGMIYGDGSFARQNSKASFTFDVRPRGDNPPSGQLTLQDRLAGLNIRVTSFSRLVIINNIAFCQGSYRTSGKDYSVWLAVIDGPASDRNDRLRIMIRNLSSGQVIYDTQPGADLYAAPTTPLTSGRITVRNRNIL